MASGEGLALAGESPGFEPRAGCQAYPAFVAAMRERYGFDDEACAFFDFFGAPSPELEDLAVRAVQAALDAGELSEKDARTHARLFQSYELDFWNTLADDGGRD
ncbi:hypothetical protein [Amycolatopsis sp. NPDC049868]|uniref:hypothetical protein n=1 Tax=Amycolatopsis sp. NPDC049868 TaxID=3363934 RepID=UPI0037AE3844